MIKRKIIASILVSILIIAVGAVAALADTYSYIRLETQYAPQIDSVNIDSFQVKAKQNGYDVSYAIEGGGKGYKFGDILKIKVKLEITEPDYNFHDIKLASCKLDEQTATDMELSEDERTLILSFQLPALKVKLAAPTDLKFNREGVATWSKVDNAEYYTVSLQKMNDYGKRDFIESFRADSNALNFHNVIYDKPGDYLVTVKAESSSYWFLPSETTSLPLAESILLTQSDIGNSARLLREDGTFLLNGEPAKDVDIKIGGKNYYFGYDGQRISGWVSDDVGWRYYDDQTLERRSGLTEIEGEKYYFDLDTGYMKTGFIKTEDGREMFFSRAGEAITGWVKLNGKIYYINKDGTKNKKQLIDQNGRTYMFDKDGALLQERR